MGFLDNTGLAHLWEKITSALSKKQNSPYVFGVLYDTSNETYTVATAPATFREFMSIYQDRELDLEIYDMDMTRARYYKGELYPLQGNAFALLFKDIQPDINMQSYNITGAHSAGFGLAGIVSSEDYTITWQALDLGSRDLANASDIPSLLSDLADDAQHRLVTDSEKAAWSAKLDTTGNAYRTSSIPFAQVDSTSTSTAFTATVPGITELRNGVCVMLRNGVVTSASGFTLNINNLGAKPCYSSMAAATRATTVFNVNYTLLCVYNEDRVDGGCWDFYYGYYSDANSIGYQLRTASTTMPTLDKFYRYRLLFTAADRTHLVPANTSSSTNATAARTVNQRPIDPFGAIYYYGHTTAINANANPTASYFWTQYNVTLGYSFNRTGSELTLTNHVPVYIKCAPQSDGSAIIDADNPYVQALPSTADGKIYIFLGIASSATTVELVPVHPVYCYRHGKIQLWTGEDWEYQRKPVTVWEVADVTQGLIALNTNLSSSLSWQLTDLDLTPYKRIKVYAKAGRKTGTGSADSSIVPAAIIEMLLDDRAKETVSQDVFIGSTVVQNPNDANRLGLLTCVVSADKTKFAVIRATSLYGTAATSNTDTYQYVFLIEGYYD